jgi:CPA1 family monovalent cation:H+ antiporter
VVSLAAALSIPLLVRAGQPFPHRNLILFITFIVILVTLVFQGLTLPWLIRLLNMEDRHTTLPEPQQERIIQETITRASLQFLEEARTDGVSNEHLANLYERLQLDLRLLSQESQATDAPTGSARLDYQRTYLNLLGQQRSALNELNRRADYDEELIRKYLALIDLEEYKVREKLVREDRVNE